MGIRLYAWYDDSPWSLLEADELAGSTRRYCFGGIVSLGWGTYLTVVTSLYEMVPGVIASLLAIYLVSRFTAEPKKEVTDMYDECVATSVIPEDSFLPSFFIDFSKTAPVYRIQISREKTALFVEPAFRK